VRDVRELMGGSDSQHDNLVLVFPEGSKPALQSQLSKDTAVVAIDGKSENIEITGNSINISGDEENIRARRVEDKSVDELSRVKSLGLFDLKDLSNEVQDVINELVEIPTQAESEVLLKAIEEKVVENYPTFEIGVKISDALEEGLAVILNISDKESKQQIQLEQIPLLAIEAPSFDSPNGHKKEQEISINLPKSFSSDLLSEKSKHPFHEKKETKLMEVTTKQEPKNEPQASQVDLEEITTEFTEQEPLLSIPVDIPTASKIGNEIDNELQTRTIRVL